jgi:hypothetical protein
MNACPYCGAAGDMPCRGNCDGGYDGYPDDWREKYASYLISCGPIEPNEAERLAVEAFESWGHEDPEEIASSDLACMREDGA